MHILKVWRHIKNPTRSIDAYVLGERLYLISACIDCFTDAGDGGGHVFAQLSCKIWVFFRANMM